MAVKVYFKCSDEDRCRFKDSTCAVTISVGHASQEGEALAETIRRINAKFKACVINVNDTLQRHTIRIAQAKDFDVLYNDAKQAGDDWLACNQAIIDQLTIEHQIFRWDDWFMHNDYSKKRAIIDDLYESNPDYRDAISQTIQAFSERYNKRYSATTIDNEFLHECSLEYLKEECSVFLLWADSNYDFELYPSKRRLAFEKTRQYTVEPYKPLTLKPLSLEIHKKKNKFVLPHFTIADEHIT